jgi:pimeloyl-ACP methyl ester carboxylesterase
MASSEAARQDASGRCAFRDRVGSAAIHSVTGFAAYARGMIPARPGGRTGFLPLPLLLLLLLLSGCATTPRGPDLAALYARATAAETAPPVIVIPGLMGSSLVDARSGESVWPGRLQDLAFSDYARLARIGPAWAGEDSIRAGSILREIGGIDIHGALLDTLEHAGRFRPGQAGEPVQDGDRRRFYTLAYDWRQPNIVAVRQLHALIDQIRLDHGDPTLRVDLIAHSNGGLIAQYYLRYGPYDVLEQADPQPWAEGRQRVRRVAMLGTPNLGAVASLQRLLEGFRFTVRTVPVWALATFPTVFETLPHPLTQVVHDLDGRPLALDLFDATVWRDNRWSVFSPEVEQRVLRDFGADGPAVLAVLQDEFARNLWRARQFNEALARPFPSAGLRIAAFGGDCGATLAGAVLEVEEGRAMLAFRPRDVRRPNAEVDYRSLLEAPGDGLVTRTSQDAADFGFVPIQQSFFLCENHARLLANRYFQNNLLNFLLRP